MSETIYRVGAKRSVLGPGGRVSYLPGDIVPASNYDDQPGRIAELLTTGHLTTALPSLAKRDGPREAPVVVGQWRVNPRDLAGKDLEALHLMILEIDVTLHKSLPETIEEARELLSIDYHPDPED